MDLPLTKVCSNCKIEKPLSDFYKYKTSKDGVRTSCKDCCKAAQKKHAKENPKKVNGSGQKWLTNNKKEATQSSKRWQAKNSAKIKRYKKTYAAKNPAKINKASSEWKTRNPQKVRQAIRKRANFRYATDPAFRILQNLRVLMRKHLKGIVKGGHSVELVGMPSKDYLQYIKTTFWPGMTETNDGPIKREVDHIRPLSGFNFTDPEEQKKAFHWSNTRALWADDNRKKWDRLDWTPAESKHPLAEWLKPCTPEAAQHGT